MAGRLTLWGAGELLRTYITRSAEPPPSFWLALCLTSPSPYMSGTEIDEPTAVSYARVELPNDIASWSAGESLHTISNAIDLTFVTATEPWGRITSWALCNADVDGFLLAVGDLEAEETVEVADQVMVAAGEITIELGPFFTPEDF